MRDYMHDNRIKANPFQYQLSMLLRIRFDASLFKSL